MLGPANTVVSRLIAVEKMAIPRSSKERKIPGIPKIHKDPTLKAAARKRKLEERLDPPRFPSQTNLERVAVSVTVGVGMDYARRVADFKRFAHQNKLKLKPIPKLDEAFCYYLNLLFEQGLDLGEGSKTLAAVVDAFPGCGPKQMLPRTRRVLQGWIKQDPQRTRPPLPWSLVLSISMKMIDKGHLHYAAAVLLMFNAYLRPGERMALQRTDLVRPMPRMVHFALHLHPAERLETSKVGLSDESILLDSPLMSWLGEVLVHLNAASTEPCHPLPTQALRSKPRLPSSNQIDSGRQAKGGGGQMPPFAVTNPGNPILFK